MDAFQEITDATPKVLLQGKDMNRSFFADDDPEAKTRLTEVEIIRNFMEENFSKKIPEKKKKLKMFLDIHAHSG